MRHTNRTKFDYHAYRGRTTFTDWLKRIALILAVLVVLLVAALVAGQDFISYTDDGIRVNLPFFSQMEEEPLPDPGNVNVVEGTPDALPDASQPEQGEPSQPETAASLVTVPLSALLDGTAAGLAQEAGADGVVVDMKNSQGLLGWQSEQALASGVQTQAEGEGVNEALAAWNEDGVYTAARLICFRDGALGADMDYTLRTESGYRWRDGGDGHWTSPSNPQVRDYLVGLMTELAQLGFDEIVLDSWGYPSGSDGTLGNLQRGEDNYPEGALDAVVTDFLAQAAQALEPYGTKLSLHASLEAAAGADGDTGLTVAAVNASVCRLWIAGAAGETASALSEAGVERPEERLVSLAEQLSAHETAAQAVWQMD